MDCVHQLVDIIPLSERAGRAVGNTLSAEDAVRLRDLSGSGHIHAGALTGIDDIPDVHTLHLVADLDTAHAFNALSRVSDQGKIQIPVALFKGLLEGHIVDIHIRADFLQSTASIPLTCCTAEIVL